MKKVKFIKKENEEVKETSKNYVQNILSHCDRDEIISRLLISSEKDVQFWLSQKYDKIDKRLILPLKSLKDFKKNYLDIYNSINSDLSKAKEIIKTERVTTEVEKLDKEVNYTLNNVSSYKEAMVKAANEELDIRKIVKNLAVAIETRFSQVFDTIMEDPRSINTRIDRLLIEYTEVLGNILEKYYKFTEVSTEVNNVTNNSYNIQIFDSHVMVFHDVIKEILGQMDLESSLLFMDLFNEKMAKIKPPKDITQPQLSASDIRLAEITKVNDEIHNKLNE